MMLIELAPNLLLPRHQAVGIGPLIWLYDRSLDDIGNRRKVWYILPEHFCCIQILRMLWWWGRETGCRPCAWSHWHAGERGHPTPLLWYRSGDPVVIKTPVNFWGKMCVRIGSARPYLPQKPTFKINTCNSKALTKNKLIPMPQKLMAGFRKDLD